MVKVRASFPEAEELEVPCALVMELRMALYVAFQSLRGNDLASFKALIGELAQLTGEPIEDEARAVHGVEACGAGDLGKTSLGMVIGKCPSCGKPISGGETVDPRTGLQTRFLSHPIPFCSYFGETEPERIMREMK